MPCYDCRSDPNSDWSKNEKKKFEEKYGTTDPGKLRNMLCTCCFALEFAGAILPKDIKEWWEKHKQWDEDTKENKLIKSAY